MQLESWARGMPGISLGGEFFDNYLPIFRLPILLFLLLTLGGCSEETTSPESQIKASIERAEIAAEQKDISALTEIVARQYKDEYQNDYRSIVNIVRWQLLRNKSVHLLIQIKSIVIKEPGTAKIELFVAMAGRPVPDVEALIDVNISLYRFEIDFLEVAANDWKVVKATWSRAVMEDFI